MLQQAKKLMPKPLLSLLRDIKLQYLRSKSPEEIFTDIYKQGKWGKGDRPFYSGGGSAADSYETYIDVIRDFVRTHHIESIVDLGCGDFQVGQHLTEGVTYIGCDIVKPLVEYNQQTYGSDAVRFLQKNIITDVLPDGDLCLIRQVLQHLSNESILQVLPKLKKYKYVIIADAQPNRDKRFVNHDIPNFSGTRSVVHGTGLWLENQPFNLPIQVLAKYDLVSKDDEYLRMALYKPQA